MNYTIVGAVDGAVVPRKRRTLEAVAAKATEMKLSGIRDVCPMFPLTFVTIVEPRSVIEHADLYLMLCALPHAAALALWLRARNVERAGAHDVMAGDRGN